MIPTEGWCGSPVLPARGIARRGPSCVGWRVPGAVGIEAEDFARRCGANFWCHKGCLLNRVKYIQGHECLCYPCVKETIE